MGGSGAAKGDGYGVGVLRCAQDDTLNQNLEIKSFESEASNHNLKSKPQIKSKTPKQNPS
jgi:hypothetical protein